MDGDSAVNESLRRWQQIHALARELFVHHPRRTVDSSDNSYYHEGLVPLECVERAAEFVAHIEWQEAQRGFTP